MIFENNHNKFENLAAASTPIAQNSPKKIFFHIGPAKSPIQPKTSVNSKNISQTPIKNSTISNNDLEIKPKFTILHKEDEAHPLEIPPSLKFITNKEISNPMVIEDKLNEEMHIKNLENNNSINIVNKKQKEVKLKKRKFKKFKIYHIEFKKLSEKEKIINKQNHRC